MEGVLQLGIDAILVVALVGVAVGWFVSQNAGLPRAFAAPTNLLLIALVGALSVVIVPAGNVAVVTAFGEVQNEQKPQ